MIDIDVRVRRSELMRRGVPPLDMRQAEILAGTLRQQYFETGPHYAEWGRDIVAELAGPETAIVHILNRILQHKILGGPIYPVQGQYLAIPLIPSAEGVPASAYNERLVFIRTRKGNLILATVDAEAIQPVYALKESVQQNADPRAQPDVSRMENALMRAIEGEIAKSDSKITGQK